MRAILASLDLEIKSLRENLEVDTTVFLHPGRLWQGRLAAQLVCLGRTGMGRQAMFVSAESCFRLLRPSAALLVGFAGATTPLLHQGHVVCSQTIIDAKTRQEWTPAPEALARGLAACQAAGVEAQSGRAITVDNPVATPHEKAFLGTEHQADTVDMEGSSFAAAATAAQIPWLMIRVVVDEMECPLPFGFSPLKRDGRLSLAKTAGYCLRHPRIFPQLSALHVAATRGRGLLAQLSQAWLGA
ncbi:MAG: hypothetical protein HYV02_07675 [Deltaproteobacteria bacterium]|nr:hypothetical protein [Deltaproteobacteria bacterium]